MGRSPKLVISGTGLSLRSPSTENRLEPEKVGTRKRKKKIVITFGSRHGGQSLRKGLRRWIYYGYALIQSSKIKLFIVDPVVDIRHRGKRVSVPIQSDRGFL
jgi:hypothetical protein